MRIPVFFAFVFACVVSIFASTKGFATSLPQNSLAFRDVPVDLLALARNRLFRTGFDLGSDSLCSTTRSEAFPTGDLFELPTRILARPNHPHPGNEGLCLDVSEFRPALALLPEEENAWNLPVSPNRLSIANVRGVNGFYVASVPVDAAVWLHYHIYDAHPIGGHSEVAVHFTEPVYLRPQFPANNAVLLKTYDLVLSLQGITSSGADFVPGSYDGSYISAIGVSLPEFKIKRMLEEKSKVLTYNLDMNSAQIGAYLRAYFYTANKFRLTKIYNVSGNKNFLYNDTLFNLTINGNLVDVLGDEGGNCVTIHMILLDSFLGPTYTPEQRTLIRSEFLDYFDPQHALQGLSHRGVFKSPEHNALGEWSQDPQVALTLDRLRNGEASVLP